MKLPGWTNLKKDVKKCWKAVVLIILFIIISDLIFGKVCYFVIMTGLPCPGCGLTRAGINVLTFHWKAAFEWNPMIFPIGAFIAYFCFMRYLLNRPCYGWKWLVAIGFLLLIAVYIYRMTTIYPKNMAAGTSPYIEETNPMWYYSNNVLHHIRVIFHYLFGEN